MLPVTSPFPEDYAAFSDSDATYELVNKIAVGFFFAQLKAIFLKKHHITIEQGEERRQTHMHAYKHTSRKRQAIETSKTNRNQPLSQKRNSTNSPFCVKLPTRTIFLKTTKKKRIKHISKRRANTNNVMFCTSEQRL